MQPLDLDANATTPLDPGVLDAMRPHWLAGGNPESRHRLGRGARRAADSARETIGQILDAHPDEVVFTSGGTEANNLALLGLAGDGPPAHIVTSPIEHPAVAEPLTHLESKGWRLTRCHIDQEGRADLDSLRTSFDDSTRLATLMLAHNETGTIQPVAELAELANERGIPLHTDAAQAIGRIDVRFHEMGVATLAAGAHKMHGPGGVGVLLVRRGVTLEPRLWGGGQQHGVRPGTPTVALAVGMAKALEIWHAARHERAARWRRLRNQLEIGLRSALGADCIVRHGAECEDLRLPQTLHIGFPGLDANALLILFDLCGVCASLGSACASGSTRPSPTLLAMGVPEDIARGSIRFSLNASITAEEIDLGIARVVDAVERSRQTSPI